MTESNISSLRVSRCVIVLKSGGRDQKVDGDSQLKPVTQTRGAAKERKHFSAGPISRFKQTDFGPMPLTLRTRRPGYRSPVIRKRGAYQVPEVSVAPDWAWSNVFDVEARSEAVASPDEMRSMLKTLLVERFGIRAHIEGRSVRG